ncbi:MAG: CPBP family intramembrane metalloprotease [Planctomycetota bacterium]|nr:CPBP family intramembrane metalloprotease [Planctomycetota bacterium]
MLVLALLALTAVGFALGLEEAATTEEVTPLQVAQVGLLLMLAGATLAGPIRRILKSGSPQGPMPERDLHPREVVLTILGFVFFTLVIAAGLQGTGTKLESLPVWASLALAAAAPAGVVLVSLVRARAYGGLEVFGLRRGGNGRAVACGLLAYVLCAPFLWGTLMVWPWALEMIGGRYEEQAWGELIREAEQSIVVIALLSAVIVPIVEELLFRGWLQPALRSVAEPWQAIVIQAALFAVLHDRGVLLPILVLALLLGYVRHATDRLAPCIAIHVVHNAVQVGLLFSFMES